MSRKIITILSIVLIASFALAACGTPAPLKSPWLNLQRLKPLNNQPRPKPPLPLKRSL